MQNWRKFITAFSIVFLFLSCGSVKKQRISEYLKASDIEVLKTKENTTEVKKDVKKEVFVKKDIEEKTIKADSLIITKPDGTQKKYYGLGKTNKKDSSTEEIKESDKSVEKAKISEKEKIKAKETVKTKDKEKEKQPDKSFNTSLKWISITGFVGLLIFLAFKIFK